MTNNDDLDRAIAAAAGAMMTREPHRSLASNVMARVREGQAPAPRRLVWMTAAASLVLCAAVAIAVIGRMPAPAVPLLPPAQPIVGQPAVIPGAPDTIASETPPAPRAIRAGRASSRVATHASLATGDVSPIEPIQTDPIVLSAIDVPQLERETTAIDTLTIERLTIEPLAASND